MIQRPPDLTGERPADWEPIQWLGARLLFEGATHAEVAKQVGRSRGTVSRWVTGWRKKYGGNWPVPRHGRRDPEDWLPHDHSDNPSSTIERLRVAGKWRDLRSTAAWQNGVLAEDSRRLAARILDAYATDPERFATLTVDDALTLARIADLFEKRAVEMANDPRDGDGEDGVIDIAESVPPGTLAALDAGPTDEDELTLAAAGDNVRAFLRHVSEAANPDGSSDDVAS